MCTLIIIYNNPYLKKISTTKILHLKLNIFKIVKKKNLEYKIYIMQIWAALFRNKIFLFLHLSIRLVDHIVF